MASDVQRWAESEARQAEAIARAERDALHTEVSALRAALERIAEMATDGQGHNVEDEFCGLCESAALARHALGRYPKEASDG